MKRCSKCNEDKDLSQFNRRGTKHQPYCRVCQSEMHRQYYTENKTNRREQIRARVDVMRGINKAYITEYLLTHPCVDCGITERVLLEFDHVRGIKVDNVTNLVSQGYVLDVVKQEIAKCEVRCANCHRRVTAQRGGWLI